MPSLGRGVYLQGNYAEAEALESKALEGQRRVLGPEDPDTLTSMRELGSVYRSLGKLVNDDQEAKQFDLLMLRLQLGLLRHEKSFTRWSEDVREIAGALEEKTAIPMVRAELELIIEVQTDEFWQDITTAMLEDVRKRLRSLVKFI